MQTSYIPEIFVELLAGGETLFQPFESLVQDDLAVGFVDLPGVVQGKDDRLPELPDLFDEGVFVHAVGVLLGQSGRV